MEVKPYEDWVSFLIVPKIWLVRQTDHFGKGFDLNESISRTIAEVNLTKVGYSTPSYVFQWSKATTIWCECVYSVLTSECMR